MSEDLIRRSDAIRALNREKSDWNCDYNVPIDNCIKRLNKVKPADGRKRGEWHRSLSDCEEGWVTCNNCGMQFDYYMLDQLGAEIENVYFTNFCPNCGADMREREGE